MSGFDDDLWKSLSAALCRLGPDMAEKQGKEEEEGEIIESCVWAK